MPVLGPSASNWHIGHISVSLSIDCLYASKLIPPQLFLRGEGSHGGMKSEVTPYISLPKHFGDPAGGHLCRSVGRVAEGQLLQGRQRFCGPHRD
jgi:hypothetical protein